MRVEIHSFYIETVRSILDEWDMLSEDTKQEGARLILTFESDEHIRDMQMWCDHAKACELIYVGDVTRV